MNFILTICEFCLLKRKYLNLFRFDLKCGNKRKYKTQNQTVKKIKKKKPTDKAHDLLPNRSLEFVYYFYIWQCPFPQPASTESLKFLNCLLYTPVGTPFAIFNEY